MWRKRCRFLESVEFGDVNNVFIIGVGSKIKARKMQGQGGLVECVCIIEVFKFSIGVGNMRGEGGQRGEIVDRFSVEWARVVRAFKLVVKMS